MEFSEGEHNIIISENGRLAKWRDTVEQSGGYLFSEEPLKAGNDRVVLTLKASDYGRAQIGYLISDPKKSFQRSTTVIHLLKELFQFSLKNEKTAEITIEFFSEAKCLGTKIEYYEGMRTSKSDSRKLPWISEVWVFVRIIFGDIVISLQEGKKFQVLSDYSQDIVLERGKSATLKEKFPGNLCSLSRSLKESEEITFEVSPIKNVTSRYSFAVYFIQDDEVDGETTAREVISSKSVPNYAQNNFLGKITFRYLPNRSISCSNTNDKALCYLKDGKPVQIVLRLLLTEVRIEYHGSLCDQESAIRTDGSPLPYDNAMTRSFLGQEEQFEHAYCGMGPLEDVRGSGPYDVPMGSGSSGYIKTENILQREGHQGTSSLAGNQREVQGAVIDNYDVTETENASVIKTKLQENYTKLVDDVHFNPCRFADILFEKNYMSVTEHDRFEDLQTRKDDRTKRRELVKWVLNNANRIPVQMLKEAFEVVGHGHIFK